MIELKLELEPQDGVSTLDLLLWVKEIFSDQILELSENRFVKGFTISMGDTIDPSVFRLLHAEGHSDEAKP